MKNSEQVYNAVRECARQRGIKLSNIIRACGLGQNYFVNWKKQQTLPRAETLKKIATYLDVSVDYLMGEEIADLPDFVKAQMLPITKKKFPLLGEIACGEPIFAEQEYGTYFEASADIQADFCLVAKGDSMTGARIFNGDVFRLFIFVD